MKLSKNYYLIKLDPEATKVSKNGIIFEREVLEGLACLLQEQRVDVLTGDPKDSSTYKAIGSTLRGNNSYIRNNALYLYIKLDEENTDSLKIVNDISMKAYPSFTIDASLDKTVSNQEDGTKVIHASGSIELKNILFCRDDQ